MARERQECANRVSRALQTALEQLRGEPGYAGAALGAAQVWDEIPGLEIDATAVVVPNPSGRGRLIISYTWDWLEANPEEAIVANLVARVRQAAEGTE